MATEEIKMEQTNNKVKKWYERDSGLEAGIQKDFGASSTKEYPLKDSYAMLVAGAGK